jgi:hypothetical protein
MAVSFIGGGNQSTGENHDLPQVHFAISGIRTQNFSGDMLIA